MDYTDAVAFWNCGKTFENPVFWGVDLCRTRTLSGEHFKTPVVTKNYRKKLKRFTCALTKMAKPWRMDVLAPGIGEIIGGSQREERLDVLDARMAEMGLNKEDYWWYRDLRSATVLYRIPALARALNALSLTSRVCKTCAMLFRSHGPHATPASDFTSHSGQLCWPFA